MHLKLWVKITLLVIIAVILLNIISIRDNKVYNECISNNGYNCIGLIK